MALLRSLTAADLPRLGQFWQDHWGGNKIVVHDYCFQPESVEGFILDDWAAVLTYIVRDAECEIVSLDSLQPQQGLGSALIDAVLSEARKRGCTRVCVTTTNDNLHALGFYQRRGFELYEIRRGDVDRARKQKPAIPMVGEAGIPLHDEIELEILLR
jgi:ribosomal protein S18 acetylase RimI-like enzyme